MSKRRGFTLVEIIVVLVIIAILCAVAIPNYFSYLQQGAAKSAQDNLITIYGAQKNLYLNSGNYYGSPAGPSDDKAGINNSAAGFLGLNITDNNFNYLCNILAGPSVSCTAKNISDPNLILTVTSGTALAPNPIILPGGSLSGVPCTANTGAAPCNPYCNSNIANYCPS